MKIRKCKYNFGNNNDGVFSTINGYATETNNFGETAVGILNKSTLDPDTFTSPDVVTSSKATLFSVGNGSDNVRKNAFEIKANGDTYINGVGGYDGTNSEDATSVSESIQSVQDSSNKFAEDIESIHIEKSATGDTYVLKVAGEDRGTITSESGISFTPGNGLQLVDTDLSVKIDSTSESYLTAGQDGLKVSGVDAKFGDYLPLTGGVLTGNLYVNGRDTTGSFGISLNRSSISVSTPLGTSSSDPYYHYSSRLDNHSLIIASSTNNEMVLDKNGIRIRNKTNQYLLHAAGGTISIDDLKTQLDIPDTSNLATKDELSKYLPLTGGTIKSSTEGSSRVTISADNNNQDYISITDTSGIGIAVYGPDGVVIYNKKQSDLLNAAGGTVSADDIALNTVVTYAGKANGIASLNESGKIPESQLPSYVDDVVEYDSLTAFPDTGESGKIYIATDTNMTYRWSGSSYVPISSSLALGETSSTAYAGDKGKANRDALNSLSDTLVSSISRGEITGDSIIINVNLATKSGLNYGSPAAANLTFTAATNSIAGLMSASDKQKLDGLSNYTLPTASATQLGGVRVGDGLEITGEGILNCTIDPGSGTVSWGNIQGKPTFSTVATSGLYSDLTGTPDLSNYVTSTQLTSVAGSNTYTGANYISKETNLTDAVIQLDEEIKATNDNLALEHANAEATYVKKAGDTMTGTLHGNSLSFSGSMILGAGNVVLSSSNSSGFIISGDNPSNLVTIIPSGGSSDIITISTGGISLSGKDGSDILTAAGSTTKLKTINSQSLLGEGNIEIQVEGGGITDAPSDNKLYGRKNAQWTEVTVPEVEVPTKVSELTNDSGFQTEAQVSAKISALVDSAPETLDTLNELAAALGDDPNFATTITTLLGNKLDTSTYNSDKATFALKSELPDMSNYALKSEVPSVESITTTDIDALFS